jgi:multiple sugar transport system substrate-binding protein
MKDKKLSRRDFLRMGALGAVGAAISACAPAEPQVVKETVEVTVKETVVVEKAVEKVVTATPVPVEAAQISYVVWVNTSVERQWNLFYVDMFSKMNPHIEVEFMPLAGSGYVEKLFTMASAGNLPQALSLMTGSLFGPMAMEGLIAPIDPLIDADPSFDKDAYFERSFAEGHQMCGGQTFGLPLGGSPMVIFYNKTLFETEGIRTPPEYEADGDWTWDNYFQAAQDLSKGEGVERQYGTVAQLRWRNMSDWIVNNGGQLLNEERTTCLMGSSEAVQAMQMQADLLHVDQTAPTPAATQAFGGDLFKGGKVGMTFNGIWKGADYVASITDWEWECAHAPVGPAGRAYWFMPHAYCVSSAATDAERKAAWEFIKFMAGPEVEANFVRGGQRMPHLKESIPLLLEESPIQNVEVFIEAIETGAYALPVGSRYNEWTRAINEEMSLVVSGDATVEEAMQTFVPKVDEILADSQFCMSG